MKKLLLLLLTIGLTATATAQRADQNYCPPKTDVTLTESTLPIVRITTGNATLSRQQAIKATVNIGGESIGEADVMWWGDCQFTHQPKKPISIQETAAAGRQWRLYALSGDRSVIRAALTRVLARQLSPQLPKLRHCEVTLDGIYYGLYLIEEVQQSEMSMEDYLVAAELAHDTECYRFGTSSESAEQQTMQVALLDTWTGYGNNYGEDGWRSDTWIYRQNQTLNALCDPWRVPTVWEQLTQDGDFRKQLRQRWSTLRTKHYSDDRITAVVDSLTSLLTTSGALDRDTEAWQLWGRRVWPNKEAATDFDTEIATLKSWIQKRTAWLDQQLSGDEIIERRSPLAIASGWNADVIAEAEPASTHVNADLDDNGFVFYSKALRASGGLPADGSIVSDASGVSYQLNDYTKDNILRLAAKGSTGTLTLTAPTTMSRLYVLAMGGNGSGSYQLTIRYADGTTGTASRNVSDWSEGGGVITANRMLSSNGSVNSYYSWYIYEDSVDIDSSKQVETLTFTSTSELGWDGYQPVVSIFALSALTQQVISGIEETRIDDFGPVVREYYDMQGRRLPHMQRGMQIVVERTARGKVSSRKVIYQ